MKYIELIKEHDEPFEESEFFEPATDEDIISFEKKYNIIIPESYKHFLKITNGAYILGNYYLYGIKPDTKFIINFDFTGGLISEKFLILGFLHDASICYYDKINKYFLYEGEDENKVECDCTLFDDVEDILKYMLDTVTD